MWRLGVNEVAGAAKGADQAEVADAAGSAERKGTTAARVSAAPGLATRETARENMADARREEEMRMRHNTGRDSVWVGEVKRLWGRTQEALQATWREIAGIMTWQIGADDRMSRVHRIPMIR